MGNIKARDLTTVTSAEQNDKVMIITDDATNRVENITIENFTKNIDAGNIEVGNLNNNILTDSGVTSGLYPYPMNLNVNDKGIVTSVEAGTPGGDVTNEYLNNSKAWSTGEVSEDITTLKYIKSYAHSTFDLSKFTQVGSPTISDDGIVSDLSSSNRLTIPYVNFNSASSWVFESPYCKGYGNESDGWLIRQENDNSGDDGFMIAFSENGLGRLAVAFNGYQTFYNHYTPNLPSNKWYQFKIEFTGTQYKFYYREKGNDWITLATDNSTTHIASGSNPIKIGYSSDTYTYKGNADLKGLSITVDGEPVFSGNKTGIDTYTIGGSTVQIPYTQSKTGSKIVDSYYRSSVQDVYDELGYAPYYTLSDTDFTLPMGEIYGLIVQGDNKKLDNTIPHIIDTYTSGTSGYIVWSNGYCEQWGWTTGETVITLLKEYKDANYNITVASTDYSTGSSLATENTASSFANAIYDVYATSFSKRGSGFWRTFGYLAEGEY